MKSKPIKGYEKLYKIYSDGRVFSLIKNKFMKVYTLPNGYDKIGLTKNEKQKGFLVHRLVAQHFIPNPQNKKCVNHKNSVRNSNDVSNLEWVTHSENRLHGLKHGFVIGNNPSKFNLTDIWGVRQVSELGYSNRQVGALLGMDGTNVSKIINGVSWGDKY